MRLVNNFHFLKGGRGRGGEGGRERGVEESSQMEVCEIGREMGEGVIERGRPNDVKRVVEGWRRRTG